MRNWILMSLLFLGSVGVKAMPQDSIGTKIKNGKVYVLHQVEKGQGLYSISRRYNVAVKDIIAENPGSDATIRIDQVLLIPTGRKAPMEEKVVKDYFESDRSSTPEVDVDVDDKKERSTFAKYHTVKEGETLYSISKSHETTVDVIKSLNDLGSSTLSIGQKILVPVSKEEKAQRDVKIEESKVKLEEMEKEVKATKEAIAKKKKTKDTKKKKQSEIGENPVISDKYERKIEHIEEFDVDKIWERGIGKLFEEGDVDQNKRVASHHEAEIGSTMMVTNPANNEAVFVKVVKNHKLDPSKGNIVILSRAAGDKIGLEGEAQVEISFAR